VVKVSAKELPARGAARARSRPHGLGLDWITPWEAVTATAAIALAVAAVWVTLRADFLAYPGWLAAQKADVVLGPVLVGLYWLRRRPRSRFGPLLIAVGFLSAPYILQSSAAPWAFSLGVVWEGPIFILTLALVLAFPTGRLDRRPERLILAVGVLGVVVPLVGSVMVAPQIAATSTISGCSGACPANAFLVSSDPGLAGALLKLARGTLIAADLAAIALIAWRFASGTPPRRRALAIGAPIALVFLGTQVAHQASELLSLGAGPADTVIRWMLVAARSSLWYGFLLALIAAELFAGRVLRRIVEASLRRPSLRELEQMLRAPLGDPGLRLAFWRSGARAGGGEGVPEPAQGQTVTALDRDGRPAVAIVHDAQLDDDPELVHAAGAIALLAHENAQLELAWTESLRQLRESRARLAAVSDVERRVLERDLHDGAQQQLTALLVKLTLVGELVAAGSLAQRRLAELGTELEQALQELRQLAHGIYPAPLADMGLVGALELVASRSGNPIEISGGDVGRQPPEIQTAVYYCCLEAMQNAAKHAGPGAHVSVRLWTAHQELRFDVHDDGPGFDPDVAHDGVGLRNMRDRLYAFDGRLQITSAPGQGTTISGALPIGGDGSVAWDPGEGRLPR
jgi:signal transduction histidine kinase